MKLADLVPDIFTPDAHVRRMEISGVTADSRAVRPGSLFAALPGTRVKGTSFIPHAVQAGAAVILVGEEEEVPADVPVPVLRDPDPQRRFARLVARYYAPQPKTVVAVTGTNGKTSVASFVRQIWEAQDTPAASIGTIGVVVKGETLYGNLTTPDPVTLHRTLHDLAVGGIDHVALEASSHGLTQRRLDGLTIAAGAFTNLSRDHLDYHGTMENYLAAKLRLFNSVLEPGAVAVVNADDPASEAFSAAARISGLELFTVGRHGRTIRIVDVQRSGFTQAVTVETPSGRTTIRVPLVGAFQVSNALVAAALAHATGVPMEAALAAVGTLKGAAGRLELVAKTAAGAPVFVDYAHTPAALQTALETLRPYVSGKLVVAFGAGGDRDKGKRPEMGAAAERLADVAIITDDNPRTEDPATIRAAIREAAPSALEIGDRAAAIRHAIGLMTRGDVLLVAGKGHETGQIVGTEVLPFSDHDVIREAVEAAAAHGPGPLWRGDELLGAVEGHVWGVLPEGFTGVSIDSRTVEAGDLFVAIKGDRLDGHDYVEQALKAGAAAALVAGERAPAYADHVRPLIVVPDPLEALRRLGAAARARTVARVIAVTGSVGKTSTKEALRHALAASGPVHASVASFNNHWGVPLTLARMPRETAFGVFEIGMNHAGEISPLTRLVRPHVAIVTTVDAVHLEHFASVEGIAQAKAEIFEGLEAGGSAVINLDNPYHEILAAKATAHDAAVVTFGEAEAAAAHLDRCVLHETCSTVTATILGETITYKIGAPGRHLVGNSLAVLAATKLVGADLVRAGLALQRLEQPKGRGRRHLLRTRGPAALLIDESYNANPTSVRAALALLGQAAVKGGARRIAVLGDMLELGPEGAAMHAGLADAMIAAQVDKAYLAGPLMRSLWQALPRAMRGAYAETAAGLESILVEDVRSGDALMVKGSFGSRMGPLVEALIRRFGTVDEAAN